MYISRISFIAWWEADACLALAMHYILMAPAPSLSDYLYSSLILSKYTSNRKIGYIYWYPKLIFPVFSGDKEI